MQKKNAHYSRYITGFDGIRTLAVIGVIFYHITPDWVKGGYLGVPVFFVLSGYLITDLLKQELVQTKKIDVLAFYIRRMKRLYPALVAMFVASSFYITIFQQNLLNNLRGVVLSSLTYVNNWWQIAQKSSYFNRFGNESPFTHIWSLAVEGQYYLLWPIVFFLLIKFVRHAKRIFLILFVLSLASMLLMWLKYVPNTDPTRVYYGSDTRMFSLLLGSALAFIWPSYTMREEIDQGTKNYMDRLGIATFLLLVLCFIFFSDKWLFVYRGGMYLMSMLSVVLAAICAHPASRLNRWLTNPLFTYIGKRSYGIYLWQYPIMIFYEIKLKNVANNTWLHTLIELVLIFGASELSYRFIEQPLKKFSYSETLKWVKLYFSAPYLELKKFPIYGATLLTAIAIFGLLVAPSGTLTENEEALQKQITENSRKAKQHQEEVEKAEEAGEKIEANLEEKLDEKYKLSKAQLTAAKELHITAFGDSVMLAAATRLQQLFPYMYMDATVSRQLYASYDDLEKLASSGKLADVVLVSLGTNGSWTQTQFEEFMKIIGENRQVFWVTVHVPTKRWQETVNSDLNKEVKRYKNLHLIEWEEVANGQNDWFYNDKVHPNEKGLPFYTKVVGQGILTKEVLEIANKEAEKNKIEEKEKTKTSSTTTASSKK